MPAGQRFHNEFRRRTLGGLRLFSNFAFCDLAAREVMHIAGGTEGTGVRVSPRRENARVLNLRMQEAGEMRMPVEAGLACGREDTRL
jgi:hypothetical protein